MKKNILFVLLFLILSLTPLLLSRFYIYVLAIILLTGLLATSLNLAIGYGGMYQFGHAVFYGLGAYTTALIVSKTTLPPFLAFIVGPLFSALISFLMGIICLRLSKLYFGMLQISLGSLIWAVVYRWYSFTGGDDGIHGIVVPEIISNTNGSFYFTLIVVTISILILHRIVESPFGKTLQAIRNNPTRSLSVGININIHKLIALTIAGFFAGISGMLFVVVDNSVFPDMMFWTYSLEILIMCLLGGLYTFWGPFIGAIVIVSTRIFLGAYTQYWSMILGIVLTLVIIFMPQGVCGLFEYKDKRRYNNA